MSNLRRYRNAARLTQAQLAEPAGVSRQLVGAAEAGRHLPRVDADMALAAVLGVGVEQLFSATPLPADVMTGATPRDGILVRAARVGDRVVTAPLQTGIGGWDVADGVVERGAVSPFEPRAQGLVNIGCEPGLDVFERMLRENGMGALSGPLPNRLLCTKPRSGWRRSGLANCLLPRQ